MENKTESRAAGVRCLHEKEIYDTFGAGAVLHRSPRWVARACSRGIIRGVKSGSWRIKGEAINDFLKGGAK